MNIFEALAMGNGKATLPEHKEIFVRLDTEGGIFWDVPPPIITSVYSKDYKRIDWIPYVPHETSKNSNLSSLSPCEVDAIDKILIKPDVPHEKTKNKYEVYRNVSLVSIRFNNSLESAFCVGNPLKVTVEWEE